MNLSFFLFGHLTPNKMRVLEARFDEPDFEQSVAVWNDFAPARWLWFTAGFFSAGCVFFGLAMALKALT